MGRPLGASVSVPGVLGTQHHPGCLAQAVEAVDEAGRKDFQVRVLS
jgi:hypothetical protein